MKIAAIFLIAFLATGYASFIPNQETAIDNLMIEVDDAIPESKSTAGNVLTVLCLKKKVKQIKQDIATITGVIGSLKDVISSNQLKLQECQQIGGNNPSIIDQISQTTCSINVAKDLKAELLATVDNVTSAVDDLIHIQTTIRKCFN